MGSAGAGWMRAVFLVLVVGVMAAGWVMGGQRGGLFALVALLVLWLGTRALNHALGDPLFGSGGGDPLPDPPPTAGGEEQRDPTEPA